MRLNNLFDDISFTPFRKEFKGYNLSALHKDLSAGISVALLTLPQAMAYSLIAGLPMSAGLFAAIFSGLIAALFGSSRHLVIGPSNAIAILIQYATAEVLNHHFRDLSGLERQVVVFQVMTQLTALVAIIHLLAVSFRLGRLTQFVSYSVVLGYITGVAAAIVINQLYVFLGIQVQGDIHSLYSNAIYLVANLNQIHWATFGVGFASIAMLIGLRKWDQRIPGPLITFFVVTLGLFLLQFFFGGETLMVQLVKDAGEVTNLTPVIQFPHFDFTIMSDILPVAFAVALLSILETSSVAKSIASSTGQRLSINQEILGLGLGNFTSALVGAMPISGSTSRSALNFSSGAQTRLSAIFAALMVGLILYIFGDLVSHIPLTALSALLLVTAMGLVKKQSLLLCLKSTQADFFVFWATFLSCIFFSIDVAFYIGVSLSITLYLRKAAVPQVIQYIIDDAGRIKSLSFCGKDEQTKIRFIKVKGELFFGAADLFQTTLKSIAEDDTNTRVIILQLKNARDIDATACLALQQLYDYVKGSGRYLILSGITQPLWDVLSDSGLVKLIGKENLFVIDEMNPQLYIQKTIDRAKYLAENMEGKEVQCEEVAPGIEQVKPAGIEEVMGGVKEVGEGIEAVRA